MSRRSTASAAPSRKSTCGRSCCAIIEGVVHHISNGEIRTLANKSKDFSYYVIDIGVGYDDDTDRIVEVVRDAAARS